MNDTVSPAASTHQLKWINILYVPVWFVLLLVLLWFWKADAVSIVAMVVGWLGMCLLSKRIGKDGFHAALSVPVLMAVIWGVKGVLYALGVKALHLNEPASPSLFVILMVIMPVITNHRALRNSAATKIVP